MRPDDTLPSQAVDIFSKVHDLLKDKSGDPWLMVLDGADEKDIFIAQQDGMPALGDFIPRAEHGRVLITSRDSRIAGLADGLIVPTRNCIKVDPMTKAEGVELLKTSIPLDLYEESDRSKTESCEHLVDLLGALPLALSQAAAFIRYDRVPLDEFFEMYQGAKDHSEMFRYPAYAQGKELQSVLLTWEMSYKRIGGRAPPETKSASAKLLDLMGFFHSRAIPKPSLQRIYQREMQNDTSFSSAMGRLLNFCLVYQNTRSDEYWIHPVVHEWIHRRLGGEERCQAIEVVVREFHGLFPALIATPPSVDARNKCISLLPHVASVVESATENLISNSSIGELCSDAGLLAGTYGVLDISVRLLRISVLEAESQALQSLIVERRLRLAKSLIGSADAVGAIVEASACVDMAVEDNLEDVKHWIGESLRLQGKSTAANDVEKELLNLRIQRYGEISEPVARTKHAIAYNLRGGRDLFDPSVRDHALSLCKESIATYQELGLTSHMNYLIFISQFATFERDLTAKEQIVQPLLEASVRLFGYGNIDTVQFGLQRIAILSNRDQWTEIEHLGKEFLGHEPSDVQGKALIKWSQLKNMLGVSIQRQGRPAEAEIYHRQCVNASKKFLGASSMVDQELLDVMVYNLALCLARQSKFEDEETVRRQFPGSVDRAELLYRSIKDRLKEDKEQQQQNLAADVEPLILSPPSSKKGKAKIRGMERLIPGIFGK